MSVQLSVSVSHSNLNVAKQSTGPSSPDSTPKDAKVDETSQASGNNLPVEKSSAGLNVSESNKSEVAKLAEAVKSIEEDIQNSRREIKFEVSEELGTPIVSVLDQDTKEVIRQFPPEEVIALAERVAELGDEGGKLFQSIV